jgi:hypothetical protein
MVTMNDTAPVLRPQAARAWMLAEALTIGVASLVTGLTVAVRCRPV